MKKLLLSCIALLCLISAFATADDKKAGEMKMSAEEEKMMANWMAYMTPGKEHAEMAKMVGEWKTETKWWMKKGTEPQVSNGTSKCEMVMGGRYLSSRESGTAMGMPFEGHGMMGYDNSKKKYINTWIDNMGTGIMLMEGTASADDKIVTYTGKMDDPTSGQKDKPYRMVATHIDDNHRKFEMWDAVGTADEYKVMEINYSR